MNTNELFQYEDGSVDTPDEELLAMNKMIWAIPNPIAGKIYGVGGRRCLCLAVNVSYGGGMTDCWAVEGYSAQLTVLGGKFKNSGYVKGKCLRILGDHMGIIFQPSIYGSGWQDERERSFNKKFISLESIGRYDTNWILH